MLIWQRAVTWQTNKNGLICWMLNDLKKKKSEEKQRWAVLNRSHPWENMNMECVKATSYQCFLLTRLSSILCYVFGKSILGYLKVPLLGRSIIVYTYCGGKEGQLAVFSLRPKFQILSIAVRVWVNYLIKCLSVWSAFQSFSV